MIIFVAVGAASPLPGQWEDTCQINDECSGFNLATGQCDPKLKDFPMSVCDCPTGQTCARDSETVNYCKCKLPCKHEYVTNKVTQLVEVEDKGPLRCGKLDPDTQWCDVSSCACTQGTCSGAPWELDPGACVCTCFKAGDVCGNRNLDVEDVVAEDACYTDAADCLCKAPLQCRPDAGNPKKCSCLGPSNWQSVLDELKPQIPVTTATTQATTTTTTKKTTTTESPLVIAKRKGKAMEKGVLKGRKANGRCTSRTDAGSALEQSDCADDLESDDSELQSEDSAANSTSNSTSNSTAGESGNQATTSLGNSSQATKVTANAQSTTTSLKQHTAPARSSSGSQGSPPLIKQPGASEESHQHEAVNEVVHEEQHQRETHEEADEVTHHKSTVDHQNAAPEPADHENSSEHDASPQPLAADHEKSTEHDAAQRPADHEKSSEHDAAPQPLAADHEESSEHDATQQQADHEKSIEHDVAPLLAGAQ